VLVEVDVGQRRCGVAMPADAVALGRLIASLPGLVMGGVQVRLLPALAALRPRCSCTKGMPPLLHRRYHLYRSVPSPLLQCYHGGAQHIRSTAERRAVIAGVAAQAAAVRDALLAAAVPCPVVTGGGTGTFLYEAASGVFTEVQPGSYVLGDADYARNLDDDGQETWTHPFAPALLLLTTVMSRRAVGPDGGAGWVVVDSGLKAQSTESGNPVVVAAVDEFEAASHAAAAASAAAASKHAELVNRGGVTVDAASSTPAYVPIAWSAAAGGFDSSVGHLRVKSVSDEHSTLVPAAGDGPGTTSLPALGTKLLLQPAHCDPFVNHYDWLIGVRGGVVEAVWRITARSPGI
jgi:D-serine deaminase-like pyridoxal phosphate-dependent protein